MHSVIDFFLKTLELYNVKLHLRQWIGLWGWKLKVFYESLFFKVIIDTIIDNVIKSIIAENLNVNGQLLYIKRVKGVMEGVTPKGDNETK